MKRVILQAPDYVLTRGGDQGMRMYFMEDGGNGLQQVMLLFTAIDLGMLVTEPCTFHTLQQPLLGLSIRPPYIYYGGNYKWSVTEPVTELGGAIVIKDVSPPRSPDFMLQIELHGRCATDVRIAALKELGFTEVEEEKGTEDAI